MCIGARLGAICYQNLELVVQNVPIGVGFYRCNNFIECVISNYKRTKKFLNPTDIQLETKGNWENLKKR